MKYLFLRFIVPALSVLVLLIGPACQREPIYIGSDSGNPGGGTDTGGGGDTSTGIPCSPDSVYFNQQVLPILTSNCAMSGCHDEKSRREGVILTSYDRVLQTGGIRVSSPSRSKIYSSLSAGGEERMPPPPRAALTDAQKNLILKWIQQGALNRTCDAACDETQYGFSAVIKPLIDNRCVGCHGAVSPEAGIRLTTYAEIKATVDNGKLWGSVAHLSGYTAMPYPAGSAKLPDCQLNQIRHWIDAGAPND